MNIHSAPVLDGNFILLIVPAANSSSIIEKLIFLGIFKMLPNLRCNWYNFRFDLEAQGGNATLLWNNY